MAVEEKSTVSSTATDMTVVKATVMSLLDMIMAGEEEGIKQAVTELRLLSKWEMNYRIVIGEAGGIPLVVSALCSSDPKVQENAVTALLNLSIYPANRATIMATRGAVDSISEVLRAGATSESKENVAALLSSLLIAEEHRDIIGKNSALLGSLRDLLHTGRSQGKKDAIRAIFHLALWPGNRSRLVSAGVISPLRALLVSPRAGLVEDTLAVLAQIARCREGTDALKDPGNISVVVDYLENGSRTAKENAASLLLSLCQTGGVPVADEVRRHKKTVVAILCSLLASGSSRAKAKAHSLMKIMVVSGTFSFSSGGSV